MKKLLQGIGEWIADLFDDLLPDIKKAIEVGVDVTEAIKNFDTANPEVADIITNYFWGFSINSYYG